MMTSSTTQFKQFYKSALMLLVCAATLPIVPISHAQGNYPNKVIKVVVPQPPGGGFDF